METNIFIAMHKAVKYVYQRNLACCRQRWFLCFRAAQAVFLWFRIFGPAGELRQSSAAVVGRYLVDKRVIFLAESLQYFPFFSCAFNISFCPVNIFLAVLGGFDLIVV